MQYLAPCTLLVTALALGFLARTRFGMPTMSRWFVLAFALAVSLFLALSGQFQNALLIGAAGLLCFVGSLANSLHAKAKLQHRFCPNCATELKPRDIEGKIKMACPKCAFVHWNNPIVVGVAFVPSEDGKSILLVKRGVEPKKGMYCLPGGFGEPNEHPADTSKREGGEEATLDLIVDRLLAVHAAPGGNQVLVFYLMKPTSKEPKPGSDALEAKFFPLDALPENIAFSTHREVIAQWTAFCLAGKK